MDEFGSLGFHGNNPALDAADQVGRDANSGVRDDSSCMSVSCQYLRYKIQLEAVDNVHLTSYAGKQMKNIVLCGFALNMHFTPENILEFVIDDGTNRIEVKYNHMAMGVGDSSNSREGMEFLKQHMIKTSPVMVFGECDIVGRRDPIVSAFKVLPKLPEDILIHLFHAEEDRDMAEAAKKSEITTIQPQAQRRSMDSVNLRSETKDVNPFDSGDFW